MNPLLTCTLVIGRAFATQAPADDDWIFHPEQPELFPVWTRIGDVSPALRAVETIELSPDSRWAVSGGKFGYQVMLWRTADGHLLWQRAHESEVECVTFSPDGKRIASGGEDFYVQTKNPETGATDYGGFATLLDVSNLTPLVQYSGHGASVKSVRLSADQRWVATGGFDGTARLFDRETGKSRHVFDEDARVEAIAFTPDNRYLIVGGHRRSIRFYRTSDFGLAHEHRTPRTEYIDVSDDGRLLATAHEDSGLIQLQLFGSDTQQKMGQYQRMADQQLNNRDLGK